MTSLWTFGAPKTDWILDLLSPTSNSAGSSTPSGGCGLGVFRGAETFASFRGGAARRVAWTVRPAARELGFGLTSGAEFRAAMAAVSNTDS